MKKLLFVTLLALVSFMRGRAQEMHFYQEHPHSVEISTGPPFFFAMMYPPGNMDNGNTMREYEKGIRSRSILATNLSLAYNYQENRHWEFSAIFTHCGYFYSSYQYPEKGTDQGRTLYNWDATPENLGVKYDARGFFITGLARYYWYTKKPSFQWYSAAGVGFILGSNIRVWPVLTPIGIRFGGRHWYGRAELTLGTTATLVQLGVGRRF